MSLYRRKDSPFYWMSFRIKGRPRSAESTGTQNRKLAERIHAGRLTEIAEGRWFKDQGKDAHHTLGELIERYSAEYLPKKKHKTRDLTIIAHLRGFFEGDLRSIENTIGRYEAHRNDAGISPATIVKELGLLRRMCNLAIRWRWLKTNPVALIEMPRVNNSRVRYLKPEELKNLMATLPAWLRPIVTLARHTGLRRGNLLELTWEQVDLKTRQLFIPQTKSGEPLGLPLNETAAKLLYELRHLRGPYVFCDERGEPWGLHQTSVAFRRAVKRAGITHFKFHDLRHDFASRLVQGGVDIYRVKDLLGHKDLRMTTRYAHLSPENLRDAVNVLDDRNGYVLATLTDGKASGEVKKP